MVETFYNQFPRDQVQIFAISNSDDLPTTRQFAENFGLTFPVLMDSQNNTYFRYAISGLSPYPRDCIIDQNGIIRYLHSEYDPQVMLKTINELLATDIGDNGLRRRIALDFALTAYPNPFNSRTQVTFNIPRTERTIVDIVDASGRLVKRRDLGLQSHGQHISLNLDFSGKASGVYFIMVRNGLSVAAHKIVLLN